MIWIDQLWYDHKMEYDAAIKTEQITHTCNNRVEFHKCADRKEPNIKKVPSVQLHVYEVLERQS